MTAQDQAVAVVAAFNGALPTQTRAFDLDEVPTVRPKEYVEVTVSRIFGGVSRVSSNQYLKGYRVTARGVSQISVSNVRSSLEKCRSAVEFKRLTVGSQQSTPVQFETEDPAAADEGRFSGLLVFTYAIRD